MITIAIIIVVLVTFYLYFTRNFKYWEVRGVKHDKPIVLFGNNFKNWTLSKNVTEIARDMYNKYPNEKVVGFYRGSSPELIIRDPEIIKRILNTDFIHFSARGLNTTTEVIEPLFKNLFTADGDLWRLLRTRLTPTFTSGKLRAMFPLIIERAMRLQARTLEQAAKKKELDARELMARYTMDFIGACGFGIDSDTLKDDNSSFYKLGRKIFTFPPKVLLIIVGKELFPNLMKNFKVFGRVEDDILELVNFVIKERNNEPSGRHDFVDLLLEVKKNGNLVGESIEKFKPDGTPEIVEIEFDNAMIAAQAFIFFAAGFETSSSATSYTLHHLAFYPEVQKKVQDEVDAVLAKHNGKLTYDGIKEMTYLEATLKEGLRIFPVVAALTRDCVHHYTIPELGINLTPGVGIVIPTLALNHDPQYFDNPSEFRPERFLPENADPIHKLVFKPFGDGPRFCIGARMAMMQSVAGLAAILSKYTVAPGPNTKRYLEINPLSKIVQDVKGGVPLLFQKRDQ